MSDNSRQRNPQQIEKRGGYGSSLKPVAELKRPPAGAAPGAPRPAKPATK